MTQKQKQKDRITRYRKAYPLDVRSNKEIMVELIAMRKEKTRLDGWIERAVYEKHLDGLFDQPIIIPPLDPEEGWL